MYSLEMLEKMNKASVRRAERKSRERNRDVLVAFASAGLDEALEHALEIVRILSNLKEGEKK
jgi:hypothetical protein